jgi:hypothetical protein
MILFARMQRGEFEAIWALPGKCVNEDIVFTAAKGLRGTYCFDDIEVLVDHPSKLLVHGTFNCRTGALIFNFTLDGVGPVCRYCLGGTAHGDAGRWHQHLLRQESHPRQNLPFAIPRLTLRGLSAIKTWEQICQESNITHTADFFEPEVQCK